MTASPQSVPSPAPTAQAVRWEVICVYANTGGLDPQEMADCLNAGWEFMGIQSGSHGDSSYAYFKRAVPVKP
jgi:hypothetical protein